MNRESVRENRESVREAAYRWVAKECKGIEVHNFSDAIESVMDLLWKVASPLHEEIEELESDSIKLPSKDEPHQLRMGCYCVSCRAIRTEIDKTRRAESRLRELENERANSFESKLEELHEAKEQLLDALTKHLVSGYGYYNVDTGTLVDVIRCDCGARVEGQGRDPSKVDLEHMGDCPLKGWEYVPEPATKPAFPCNICGKETKEHHREVTSFADGVRVGPPRRICSDKRCRNIQDCQ